MEKIRVAGNGSELVMFASEDGKVRLETRLKDETVWLTFSQMAELFDVDKSGISRHLKKIFETSELRRDRTVAFFATAQNEGIRKVKRDVEYYNLDAIISVGYRVNSMRGTQFRIWASKVLRDFLVKGYALNESRLREKDLQLRDLRTGIRMLRRAIESREEPSEVIGLYETGLSLLDDYDHQTLDDKGLTLREAVVVMPTEFRSLVDRMRKDFDSGVFGKEKDAGFDSSVRQIYQSFGGTDLYPSIEEKAATLLYLITKNHSFIDGNKRIAAACFLHFLAKNGLLCSGKGESVISDDGLAALTLFVAVSKPDEMETVKRVIISVLNRSQA